MSDLHTRLVAAVNARLEVARAVCREPKGIVWRTARDAWDGSRYHLHEVMAPDLIDPMGSMMVDPEVAAYLNIHHPADAIRRYERDLRVLERHAELPDSWGSCSHCRSSSTDLRGEVLLADWPCDEIRDLATAYGMEADHA